jgi:phosphoglycolate phosphatase
MYESDIERKLKKSDIIRLCLEEMGCYDYKQAVYVGDGESDGKGANSVGVDFIAVTYGFGFKTEEDAKRFNPIGVARNSKQIEEIVTDIKLLN